MEYKRHIIMDCPGDAPQLQIFEYDTTAVVWLGHSPEIYTPKESATAKGMVDGFVASLLAGGYKMVGDKCA